MGQKKTKQIADLMHIIHIFSLISFHVGQRRCWAALGSSKWSQLKTVYQHELNKALRHGPQR